MAPEPLEPDVSTPMKLITVIEEIALCERFAVTETLLSGDGENARQISAVPFLLLVRTASDHASPPPETFFTLSVFDVLSSASMNASSSSFPCRVENAGEVTVELALDRSLQTWVSMTGAVNVAASRFKETPWETPLLLAVSVAV